MQLIVDRRGRVFGIYDEMIDLTALGHVTIRRGSQVEPDEQGQWWADLSPVSGPRLGPFPWRSEALAAEREWLQAHWLPAQPEPA